MTAPTPRQSPLGFWLLIAILLAIGIFKSVITDSLDPDSFWHIKVADQLLHDGIHPLVDHLSFSSIKVPWTPYSWLAEFAMKWTWDTGGYRLSLLLRAAMVSATTLFIALACLRFAGKDRRFNCVVAMIYFAYLSLPYLSFRPATAAIALLALCAWLLIRDRKLDERSRAVWLLIPLTALTINIHLTAVVIPMWTGAMLAGALFEQHLHRKTWFRRPSRLSSPKSARASERSDLLSNPITRYALLFIACSFACCLTPMLPGAIQTALHYQSSDIMVNRAQAVIAEMKPIYRGSGAPIALTLLALVYILAYRNRKTRPGELLCLLIGTILMLRLGRFAPIFGMFAAPLLAASMPALSDKPLTRRPVQIGIAALLILFSARIIKDFPPPSMSLSAWLNRPDIQFPYPTESADYVDANIPPHSGRLLNDFTWGGYLEWRLGNKYQTLLDGRTQLFTADFWNHTLLQTNQSALADFLTQQNADAAILPVDKSALRPALLSKGWTIAHHDTVADVLIPPR